jgi:hypothetical protein
MNKVQDINILANCTIFIILRIKIDYLDDTDSFLVHNNT